jgi:hypothetical protein
MLGDVGFALGARTLGNKALNLLTNRSLRCGDLGEPVIEIELGYASAR